MNTAPQFLHTRFQVQQQAVQQQVPLFGFIEWYQLHYSESDNKLLNVHVHRKIINNVQSTLNI